MKKHNKERINNLEEAISYNLLQTCQSKIKASRTLLVLMAMSNLLMVFYTRFAEAYNINDEVLIIISNSIIFLLVAFLITRVENPRKAVAVASFIYIGTIILFAYLGTVSLFKGWVLKMTTIVALMKTSETTFDLKDLQERYKNIENKKNPHKGERSRLFKI